MKIEVGKYYRRKGEEFIIKVIEIEHSNRVKVEVISKNKIIVIEDNVKYTNTFLLEHCFEEYYK